MNYYTLFEIAEEECLDILQSSDYGVAVASLYTPEVTRKMVLEKIETKKEYFHTKPTLKKAVLIALVAAMLLSIVAVAKYYWELWDKGGTEEITEENGNMIGKEIIYDGKGIASNPEEVYAIEGNEIIKSAEKDAHIPRDIAIFSSAKDKGVFTTPEIMTTNDAMALLTSPDRKGWNLKKGDALIFSVELYASEAVENQQVVIMNIVNGVLKEELNVVGGKSINYKVVADEPGYYNIGAINASSDTISFKKGEIYVTNE